MSKKLKVLVIVDIVLLLAVIAGFEAIQYVRGLEMKGEPDMTVYIGDEFVDPGVRSVFAKANGEVDTSVEGDYVIEYTLGSRTSYRTVHVVDKSHIILGLKGSRIQKIMKGDPYIEGGAFAIDDRTGALGTEDITISGEVDTGTPGQYEVTYSVTSDGITAATKRTVEVLDKKDFGSKAEDVPVMMYHWIYNENDVPEKTDGNWILDTELEKHLKYLKENEYYYPSFAELRAWVDGKIELPEKSMILTFDDGKKAFLENGKPLFEKYEIPVTSFMIGWDKNAAADKVKEYASEYIQFQNHTFAMHQAGTAEGYRGIMANRNAQEILEDFRSCQNIIKNNDAMAYPYGDCPPDALAAADEQGFLCSFTTVIDKVKRGQDHRMLPRVRVYGDAGMEAWKKSIK